MASNQQKEPLLSGRTNTAWQTFGARYRRMNEAAWNLPNLLLKLILVGYFIFCAAFLSLRYYILPNVAQYKSNIEQIASRALGKPVSIARIEASWDGLRPHFELHNVAVHDQNGQQTLSLPRLSATVAWQSIPTFNLHLHKLEVFQPELHIQRDAKGKLYVAGLLFNPGAESGSPSADWILQQDEIVIHNGRLQWIDNLRRAPELVLENINLVVKNRWRHHRFRLTATPPTTLADPIDVRADFVHPFFTKRISDFRQWEGELYAGLQNTRINAWKPYFDYPFELQNGVGSVRTWIALDQAGLTSITADVQLSDVSTRLRQDLPQLNLLSVSGRISAQADIDLNLPQSTSFWGALKHSVSLTNFSLRTKEGIFLPETSVSNSYAPAQPGTPETHRITAHRLDLDALGKFTRYLPLSTEHHQILTDFAPKGHLKDFSVQWQGNYPNLLAYNVNGQFSGLSLKAQRSRAPTPASGKTPAQPAIPGLPGFENLSGFVEANQKGGNFSLNANDLILHLPGYFEEPAMDFDAFKMHANWSFLSNKPFEFNIRQLDFKQQGLKGSLSGKFKMPQNREPGKLMGEADISGKFTNFDIKTIGRYLPMQMPVFTRKWLTGALEDGTVSKGSFVLKGNLADFPFTKRNGRKPKGKFNLTMLIDNGKLNYRPGHFARNGKSPMWPQTEEIDGVLTVNNARMEISAKTAKTANVDLRNVLAVIPDLMSDDIMLEITGSAVGAMSDFIRYTHISPVARWIDDFTEDTKTDGNGKLKLTFQMPLNHAIDTKVQGALKFQDNNVFLIRDLPLLSHTKGKVEFNEEGFNLNDIQAQFLGGKVTISGGTQKNGRFQVKANGRLTATGLHKTYPALSNRIRGSTHYTVTIDEKGRQPNITVKSNLRGMALNFPAPARKVARESWPLTFRVSALPAPDRSTLRDQFRISLGSNKKAHYVRERSTRKYAPWHVLYGGISVNASTPKPQQGLAMNIVVPTLDINAWDKALSPVSRHKAPKKKATSGTFGIAQYLEPDHFSAKATELSVAGLRIDDAEINANYSEGQWHTKIKSRQADGEISWRDLGTDKGKVIARLTRLSIPESTSTEVSGMLTSNAAPTQIPTLDISTDNFELHGKQWGRVALLASNTLVTTGREWQIDKLTIANPDFALTSSGHWRSQKGRDLTRMTYSLDVHDAGKMLKRIGYGGVLRDGEGKVEGHLEWRNNPFNFDKASLSGKTRLDMKSGQFLKVEPGAARLLSILSLQSLPNRLTLDFRDVFSSGFAFDKLVANADIKNGNLKTDNLKMYGVNATVLMEGIADLQKETQNLHVVVIPEVDAAAASVLYGLAVNPVIGIGTFLAQLILRDPLQKVLTYEYQVTGTWDDPTITEIKRKSSAAKNVPPTKTDSK